MQNLCKTNKPIALLNQHTSVDNTTDAHFSQQT